jgi:hypoxanthine-guanine phosphoribosyltransferase
MSNVTKALEVTIGETDREQAKGHIDTVGELRSLVLVSDVLEAGDAPNWLQEVCEEADQRSCDYVVIWHK